MTNILEAISNIVLFDNFEIRQSYSGRNRMNSMGEALESFIKDSFSGAFTISDG